MGQQGWLRGWAQLALAASSLPSKEKEPLLGPSMVRLPSLMGLSVTELSTQYCTVSGVGPDVTHQTSWLEAQVNVVCDKTKLSCAHPQSLHHSYYTVVIHGPCHMYCFCIGH